MRRVTCSRVLKGSLCAFLFLTLSAALFLWVWVEGAATPSERAARQRGCVLCHSSAAHDIPALRRWQPGTPLSPILRRELLQAHPHLSHGAVEELTDWLTTKHLPHLAETRKSSLGASLYRAKCAACHGTQGEGQPGTYPPLRGSDWLTATPSRLPEILTRGLSGPITVNGTPWNATMLPPGLTTEEEIQAVIEYIRSEFAEQK